MLNTLEDQVQIKARDTINELRARALKESRPMMNSKKLTNRVKKINPKSSNFKKNDNVIVIAGRDKGQTGTIERILTKTNKVLVSGVNIKKKHTKPNQVNQQGGIIEVNAPIHISNVMLIDPKTNERTRVRVKKEGKRLSRVAVKTGNSID